MGIKSFVWTLFVVALFSLFAQVSNKDVQKATGDNPLVYFENSIMYTINEEALQQVVQSTQAQRFKDRDEMYNGSIILRVDDKENPNLKDFISAQKIIKKEEKIEMYDDVVYDRGDFFKLRTNELFYDMKSEIAYNNQPFRSIYYGDVLNGSHFYMNNTTSFFKAKRSHFEVDMNKNN